MKALIVNSLALATSMLALNAVAQQAATTVDPSVLINQFEATNGKFEGYRRSGAKGICATGEFVGTADARGPRPHP